MGRGGVGIGNASEKGEEGGREKRGRREGGRKGEGVKIESVLYYKG